MLATMERRMLATMGRCLLATTERCVLTATLSCMVTRGLCSPTLALGAGAVMFCCWLCFACLRWIMVSEMVV